MRVAAFELTEQLGSSGFGELWQGRHVESLHPVAVKLLRRELTAIVDTRRFLDELRAIARVAHASIAHVHDAGEHAGQLYIARELVGGESLAHRLKRGRMSSTQVAETAQQIARALQAAKGVGVSHHDLKPANIRYVIDTDRPSRERVVIVDFGMAPVVATAIEGASSQYLAPEQWTHGANTAADVYALGCMMFEMLCLHPPFGNATGVMARSKHLNEPAPTASSVMPDVSSSLDRLIAMMLHKQTDRRPHSFSDIARLLDMIVGLEAPLAETVKN